VDLGRDLIRVVQKQVTKGKKTALHLALSKASFAKDGNFGKVVDLASFFLLWVLMDETDLDEGEG